MNGLALWDLRGLASQCDPRDLTMLLAAAILFLVVTALAAYVRAQRATWADPMSALRAE